MTRPADDDPDRGRAAGAASAPRPRKDVRRNRARLLEAADRLLTERGIRISFNELAAAAGTGVGTVYRHFADLDELLASLVERRLDRAQQLLAEAELIDDPVDALREAIVRTCAIQRADRAFWQVLQSAGGQHLDWSDTVLLPILDRIVGRARATGRIRPDCTATDLMMIFWISGALTTFTADLHRDVARRFVDALLDGFMTSDRDRTPHLPAPLTVRELHQVAEHGEL